jgi:hypothetical protein
MIDIDEVELNLPNNSILDVRHVLNLARFFLHDSRKRL